MTVGCTAGFRLLEGGDNRLVQLRKVIQQRIRGALAGDRNAAVAINVGERNAVTKVSSVQTEASGRARRDTRGDAA